MIENLKMSVVYVKLKRSAKKSRISPPLGGPVSPLGLPFQRGFKYKQINEF
jgi:hypothetical protein